MWQAILRSGRELLFCGHHYREHEVGLTAKGAEIKAVL
ncbi:hypothetical protein PBI_GAIA_99 [Mycobacterium phage Gaia]|uniref:DUF7455 domain-containing protein n=1 Tax=Mycobacterium phage Gaia TaxID=1486472 RepID=A0A068F3J5_9CAUD|nr:hypothetical protein VC46_gp134 [Mycobacterium phage Gaia]AID58918.1 hypothetical protein PBI_GAIA_99 [Mycobacterium phage Gaia]AYR00035.1 hypothetical protein PBI_NEBKISS_99 [Mycobacterium phage Nebkiss]